MNILIRNSCCILLVTAVTAAVMLTACSRKQSSQSSAPSNTSYSRSSPPASSASIASPQSGNTSTSERRETPIDVNAMFGNPPMDADEAALAKKVSEAIAADPRITSKRIYVGVTHVFNGTKIKDPSVTLARSVASEEESTAAFNDVIKMEGEGWILANSLSVDPSQASQLAQSSQSAQAGGAPGPWSEPPAAEKPSVPLCPGLTIVTAIASGGDYESIKTIESVDSKQVRIKYSSESSRPWWEVPPANRNCEANTPGCAITGFTTHRTVLAADFESAHKYDQIFVTSKIAPETAPGTTAIGTSAEVLRELKTKGESQITICAGADDTQLKTSDGLFHLVPGGCFAWRSPMPIRRVGNKPVPVRVIVDGAPVDLPAIQALGIETSGRRNEFFFLDDERNPLTLKFRLGIGKVPALSPSLRQRCEIAKTEGNLGIGGDDPPSCDLPEGGDRDVLTVTKITTKCELPRSASNSDASSSASALEKSLAETGKVDIYSIYFSFNSDKLRDESQPTLKDIAEVLRRHPDWKLQVNGHTDGIGGDQSNLDLSRRRASAVKDALVKQYKIDSNRLATAGYGKSQPRDTNETLEGRARNRRVELMKIS